MLPVMEPKEIPTDRVRLNVSVTPELHKELRKLSAETGETFTVLIPRLLRTAVQADTQRLGRV
jgi:hypothetical protein